MQGYKEIRKKSWLGKLFERIFIAFNIFMLTLLLASFLYATFKGSVGAAIILTGFGIIPYITIWLVVGFILYVLVYLTRGEKLLVSLEDYEKQQQQEKLLAKQNVSTWAATKAVFSKLLKR